MPVAPGSRRRQSGSSAVCDSEQEKNAHCAQRRELENLRVRANGEKQTGWLALKLLQRSVFRLLQTKMLVFSSLVLDALQRVSLRVSAFLNRVCA